MPITIEQDKYLFIWGRHMKSTVIKKLFVSFVVGIYFILFNSFCFAGDKNGIQLKDQLELESPDTRYKKYSYQYYSSCSVYYDINRKLYFYLEDGSWKIFSALPRSLKRQLSDYVKIEMDTDKPYLDNEKHVKKFPPKNSKKPKKNMWSKLVFLLFYEHAPR